MSAIQALYLLGIGSIPKFALWHSTTTASTPHIIIIIIIGRFHCCYKPSKMVVRPATAYGGQEASVLRLPIPSLKEMGEGCLWHKVFAKLNM